MRTKGLFAALLCVLVALPTAAGNAYPRPGTTHRVSVAPDGSQSEGSCLLTTTGPISDQPVISANGRFIAFKSCANNLVENDNGVSDIFLRDLKEQQTSLVSASNTGVPAAPCASQEPAITSSFPSISATGRFVAFQSCAPNLVVGDINPLGDVFVRDMRTGSTELVSIGPDGSQFALTTSAWPRISGNGRFVTFTTGRQVYVRDRKEGQSKLASLSSAGEEARNDLDMTGCSSITSDGRYVVFKSVGDNLVSGDMNQQMDTFVRDMQTGMTERVSVASDGAEGSDPQELLPRSWGCAPGGPMISEDGRFVSFDSYHSNLIPNDANLNRDVFVHDRKTARTERVSVGSSGHEAVFGHHPSITQDGRFVSLGGSGMHRPGCSPVTTSPDCPFLSSLFDRKTGAAEVVSVGGSGSYAGGASQDGRFTTFSSGSDEVVAGDTNEAADVFLVDRGPELGVGALGVSGSGAKVNIRGAPSFARTAIIQVSDPNPDALLGSRDAGELVGASIAYRPHYEDLFVAIELEHMPQVLPGVISPVLYGLRFRVADHSYEVRATSLLGGTFGLFDCTASLLCNKVTDLKGGYGTTGERAVFSLPVAEAGLQNGDDMSDVEAFSALGSYLTGATKVLDSVGIR